MPRDRPSLEDLGEVSYRMNFWERGSGPGVGGGGGASRRSPHTHHLYVALLGVLKQVSAGIQQSSKLEAEAALGVGVIGGDAQQHPEGRQRLCRVGPPPPPQPLLL